MKLAIVGSTKLFYAETAPLIRSVIVAYNPSMVVSGGAAGVDHAAAAIARQMGIEVDEIKADWRGRFGVLMGFDRNQEIVNRSDTVFAIMPRYERFESGLGGTNDTVRKARIAGKPVQVHFLYDGWTKSFNFGDDV